MSTEKVEKTEKKTKKSAAPKVKTANNWKAPLEFPYAVLRTGSKQYCVSKGDQILVEKLNLEPGSSWTAEEVLFIAQSPGKIQVGKPTLAGAKVKCEVLQQTLDGKILIRHSRRRQSSQKTLGHRQPLTRLLVTEIVA
jgi:large subunit ribosomal protein L21